MTSEQIRLALTIAEAGSISGAAKRLYLTQPTVSGTLAALEREVGCTLFKRSSHGAAPTAEGAEFLRAARRIAQELDGIAQLNRQGEVCRLHLTSFSSTRVERAFTQFCLNYQYLRRLDISYEIMSCPLERAASLIYDGKSDLVIIAAMSDLSPAQRQLLSSRQLTYEPIGRMPVAVTMAQSHPLRQGELTLERARSSRGSSLPIRSRTAPSIPRASVFSCKARRLSRSSRAPCASGSPRRASAFSSGCRCARRSLHRMGSSAGSFPICRCILPPSAPRRRSMIRSRQSSCRLFGTSMNAMPFPSCKNALWRAGCGSLGWVPPAVRAFCEEAAGKDCPNRERPTREAGGKHCAFSCFFFLLRCGIL